jgi:hypothetical protein
LACAINSLLSSQATKKRGFLFRESFVKRFLRRRRGGESHASSSNIVDITVLADEGIAENPGGTESTETERKHREVATTITGLKIMVVGDISVGLFHTSTT